MDWSLLKPIAGKLAQSGLPYLGQIIGDAIPFPGGSIAGRFAGEWAGNKIAALLGVPPTPEAVSAAVEAATPAELQAKLAAGEGEAQAKWEAAARIAEAEAADRTAQSQAINQTIQAETVAKVPWWHWRHLLGYVLVILGVETATLMPLVVMGKITAVDMVNILTALMPITGIFAALNGYIAQDNTKRLTTAITGEHAPSVTDGIVKAVKSAVSKPPVVVAAPKPTPSPLRRLD